MLFYKFNNLKVKKIIESSKFILKAKIQNEKQKFEITKFQKNYFLNFNFL